MCDVRTYVKQFEKDVCYAEAKGSETGRIVFVGNSGFTRWDPMYGMKAMEDQIRKKDGSPAVWNHGIGGSTTEDQLYYYDRLIKNYRPRALVLLSHGNNKSYGYSPEEAIFLLTRLCAYARTDFPGIWLYVCTSRPTYAGRTNPAWLEYARKYDQLLEEYAAGHADVTVLRFSDEPRLFEDGHAGDYTKARKDLCIEDMIHSNQAGFDILADFFTKALDELL